MPYHESIWQPHGVLPNMQDGPAYPRWRRLLMRNAVATYVGGGADIVVGGVNVPGGADNGIIETSATSQVTLATVAVDRSRPNNCTDWIFDIRDQTNRIVDSDRPLMAEFLVQIVSEGAAGKGLCVEAGLTNSLTMAGQHTEGGVHSDATGRHLRAGSQANVVDQVATVGLVYSHDQFSFTRGAESHSVGHALDASGIRIVPNGKIGQNTVLGMTGRLYAYFSMGRSVGDGVSYSFGVRVYIREPIMQMARFLP